MQKFKNKIILGVNVIIMIIVLGTLFFNNISFNVEASSDVNITFDAKAEEGNEVFTYTIGEEVIELKEGYVPKSTKITLKATPNEGYRFKYWIYDVKGVTKKLSSN